MDAAFEKAVVNPNSHISLLPFPQVFLHGLHENILPPCTSNYYCPWKWTKEYRV